MPTADRRIPRVRLLVAASAGTLVLAGAAAAPATAVEPVVPSGAGLTAIGAMAVAPDGALWVADEFLGVCRIEGDRPMRGEAFCGPEQTTASDLSASSIVFATTGADGPGATTTLFAADASSNDGGIVRVRWDAATGRLDPTGLERVTGPDDSQPTALGLAPGGDLLVASDRGGNTVGRITTPATCAPCATALVATPEESVAGFARLGKELFLPQGSRLTWIEDLDGGLSAQRPAAGFPSGGYTAVATFGVLDPFTGAPTSASRVYGATAQGTVLLREGADTARPYATGFAGITALATLADGTLLVADDPSLASGGLDTSGQARIFSVAPRPASLPEVEITSGPGPLVREERVSFGLAGPDGARFECRLDAEPWSACGTGPTADRTYELTEGTHTFRARASLGTLVGPEATRVVTADRTPPAAWFDTTQTSWVGGDVRIDFSADEAGVGWECSLGEAPWTDCRSPLRLWDLGVGEHELRVRASDAVNPPGAVVRHVFRILAPPEPDPGPGPGPMPEPGPDPEPVPDAAEPAAGPAAPAEAVTARTAPPAGAGAVPGARVAARCARVAAGPAAPRLARVSGRRLLVRTGVPAGARWVKVTLRHREGTTRGVLVRLASASLPPGAPTARVPVTLGAADARRLRSGRYRVGVAFGTCRSTMGAARLAVRTGAWRGRP